MPNIVNHKSKVQETVIKLEKFSKQYRLGTVGSLPF